MEPITKRGKQLQKAGYTVLQEIDGKWYEVVMPGGSRAVVGYQNAHCIHVFGHRGEWTASGSDEARAQNGCLGEVIESDGEMRGYKRLVLDAPQRLVREYDGLYRSSSDVFNE